MKSIHIQLSVTLFIISFAACAQDSPYDNSTPEKFIISLGKIGQQPVSQNPIPFFYSENDADDITEYDETGKRAIDAFDAFKSALSTNFPNQVRSVSKNRIQLEDETDGLSTHSFSLSVSLIKNQLQQRSPEDYQFISATDPSEDGVVKISYLRLGNKAEVEVIKEKGQYLMFVKEKDKGQLKKMVEFFKKAETIFSSAIKEISNKEVTTENFFDKTLAWEKEYMALLRLLN